MFRQKLIHYTITGSLAGLFIGIMDTAEILFAKEMFFGTAEMMQAIFYTIFLDTAFGTLLLAFLGLLAVLPSMLIKKRILPKSSRWKSALFASMLLGPMLYFLLKLTSGPQASQLPARHLIVLLVALGSALSAGIIIVRLPSFIKRSPNRIAAYTASSTLLAIALHHIDSTVLVRLYPHFHIGLTLLVAVILASAVSIALLPVRRVTSQAALLFLSTVLLICGIIVLFKIFGTQNIRFVMTQETAAASDVLTLASPLFGNKLEAEKNTVATEEPINTDSSLSLPGSDLFLITVDALRYDRLEKLGAPMSIMPNLDALAKQSAVFTRGYTPIPHTSYAITSLLTGKYTRPLFDVPGAPRAHETWPEIMRRFRYETSAFFPPAVFFIDKARFQPYYRKGVGFLFKHVDARVAPKEKVALLAEHVAKKKQTGRPHFSWIHFFEAHEPYDKNCTRFGDSAEDRYNCELNTVDDALGDLFEFIKEISPNALVVVTSDHGEAFGEHGDRYHGTSLYDEQIRVPIVIHAPGILHRIIDTPVSLVDLLGTALSILDIPIPARVRSRDLSGLLLGDSLTPRDAFAEVHQEATVIYEDHKIICDVKTDLCRLYDLKKDPQETRSVAEEHPQKFAEMKHRLASWMGSHAHRELRPVGKQGTKTATHEKWPEAIQRALAGDTSIAALVAVLDTSDEPAFRQKAAELIYRTADAAPKALNSDENETDQVVDAWITALRVKSKERIHEQKLYEMSRTIPKETELFRQVILTLLSIGDGRVIPKAVRIALSESASIEDRRRALRLLGRFEKRDIASSKLIPLINNYQLTLDVAEVLGKLKCSPAVNPLVARLKRERFPERKAAIIDALSVIGDWRAVPTITDHLNMETPPPNILAAFERLVRPSPHGRRIPSEKKGQEALYFHPIKSLDLKFYLKYPETIYIRTVAKESSGSITVFCNGRKMDTLEIPSGESEKRLQISNCTMSNGVVPYNIRISKASDTINVNAVVVLGRLDKEMK